MNRQQRRHPQDKLIPPVNIQYAHNGTAVLLLFNKMTDGLAFTPQGVDDLVAKIQAAKQGLLEHQNG